MKTPKCRKIVISIENENIQTESNYFVGVKVARKINNINGLSSDKEILSSIGADSLAFYSMNISATKNNIQAKLSREQAANNRYTEFYVICDRDDYEDEKIKKQYELVKSVIKKLFNNCKVFYLEYSARNENFESFLRLHFQGRKSPIYNNFSGDDHKTVGHIYKQVMYNSNGDSNISTLIDNINKFQLDWKALFNKPKYIK